MQVTLKVPSQEVTERLGAMQLQFLEHGQPSKIDDLTRLAYVDEKELRQKVAETGGDKDKVIHHDIIDLCSPESILTKDVAKKGIIVGIIHSVTTIHFNLLSSFSCSYITGTSIFSLCLCYNS